MNKAEEHEAKYAEYQSKAAEAARKAAKAELAATTAKNAWLQAQMYAEALRNEANRLSERAEAEWHRAEGAREAIEA